MNTIAGALYRVYKEGISPALHGIGVSRCVYLPTCSDYALIAVERFGWMRGLRLAICRVARCNPMSRGGLDPVPED